MVTSAAQMSNVQNIYQAQETQKKQERENKRKKELWYLLIAANCRASFLVSRIDIVLLVVDPESENETEIQLKKFVFKAKYLRS